MEQILKNIEERAKNYFTMTNEEKDDILADFTNLYVKAKVKPGASFSYIVDELNKDITKVEAQNRYELAAVMNEVRNGLIEVVREMDAAHKQQINKQ
jgi:hypothetical protein